MRRRTIRPPSMLRVAVVVCACILAVAGMAASHLLEQPDLDRFARNQAFYADVLRDEGAVVDLVVDLRAAATAPAPDAVEQAKARFDAALGVLRARLAASQPDRAGATSTAELLRRADQLSASGAGAIEHIRAMRAAIHANDNAAAGVEARATSEALSELIRRHRALQSILTREQHASIGAGMQALSAARTRDDLLLGGLLLFALIVSALCVRQTRRARIALQAEAARTEQLAAAREAAEAANSAKSAFLTVMSHEIRTPLNGVLGMAGALRAGELTADQGEMVDTILGSGNLLLGLLNNLLDLSRIEAGKLELEPAEFDLMQLVAEVASLHYAAAHEKGLELTVQLDPEAGGLRRADPTRLRQVIGNLIGNAIKFTHEGEIVLSVDLEADAGDRDPAQIRFEVRDTGVGFDEAVKARLFLEFEQADVSITRRFGGSGLGLSICRRIVELMGGEIGCDSTPGQGACFWFRVPMASAGQAAPAAASAEPDAPRRALRVLLADDNATNRKVAAALLSPLEPDLVMAADGAEAVAAYRTGRFDLVLMDMQMPVMDGLAASRAIRAHEGANALPRTPILAMTANAMDSHVEDCRQAGMDGHVAKPLQAERLYAAVAEAVACRPDAGDGEDLRVA